MCGELITHTFWVLLQTPVLSPPLKSSSSSVWHLSMRLSLPAPFESTQQAREMTRAVTSSVATHGERQWIQWIVAMCRQTRGQSPGSWLTQPQPGLSRQLGSLELPASVAPSVSSEDLQKRDNKHSVNTHMHISFIDACSSRTNHT